MIVGRDIQKTQRSYANQIDDRLTRHYGPKGAEAIPIRRGFWIPLNPVFLQAGGTFSVWIRVTHL